MRLRSGRQLFLLPALFREPLGASVSETRGDECVAKNESVNFRGVVEQPVNHGMQSELLAKTCLPATSSEVRWCPFAARTMTDPAP